MIAQQTARVSPDMDAAEATPRIVRLPDSPAEYGRRIYALLHELEGFAPVHAVLGNNDHELVGHLPERVEEVVDGVYRRSVGGGVMELRLLGGPVAGYAPKRAMARIRKTGAVPTPPGGASTITNGIASRSKKAICGLNTPTRSPVTLTVDCHPGLPATKFTMAVPPSVGSLAELSSA